MSATGDVIAETVLETYDALPTKYKPIPATGDFFQWVPLSGIVAVKGMNRLVLSKDFSSRHRGLIERHQMMI